MAAPLIKRARRLFFGDLSLSEVRKSDFAFAFFLRVLATSVIGIFLSIVYFLYSRSQPLIQRDGWSFLINSTWNPNAEQYGVLPFIHGTLLTSALALVFAVPIAIGAALFLTELAPRWLAKPVGFLVEMLAAIPSVVYGLWGIFVLAPIVRNYIQPAISKSLGIFPIFQGPPIGIGVFTAAVILAVMILPTITAVSREVFLAIPILMREGALSLGATRWESIRIAVLKTGQAGIISAVILGLGRAMGETMAVTMLIGNRAIIAQSIFSPGATMASIIANEYAEASSDMHLSALTAVGLTLFLVSLIVNGISRFMTRGFKKRYQT